MNDRTRWPRAVHDDGRGRCMVYTSPCGRFEISDTLTQPTAHVGPWAPWTLAKRDDAGTFADVLGDDGKTARQFKTTEAAKRHAKGMKGGDNVKK